MPTSSRSTRASLDAFDAQTWSELAADEILDEALDGSTEGVAMSGRKGSKVAQEASVVAYVGMAQAGAG